MVFGTPQCEVIDDFEYADSAELQSSWVGQNGSITSLESPGFEDSNGALALTTSRFFSDDGNPDQAEYSAGGLDMAFGGVQSLSIAYKSDDVNLTDSGTDAVYLELEDVFATAERLYYTGAVNDPCWSIWYIALSEFSVVDVYNVDKIRLGAESTSISGVMEQHWDMLQRCAPLCRPEFGPVGDFTGPDGEPDCFVDKWDLERLRDAWLSRDELVYPMEPCDGNLLVQYLFENNDLGDSSGMGFDGIAVNDISFDNGVLVLMNGNDVNESNAVDIPFIDNPFDGDASFTVVMDYKTSGPNQPGILLSSARESNEQNHPMALYIDEFGLIVCENFPVGGVGIQYELDAEWHQVITTYNAETTEHRIYLDGEQTLRSSGYWDPNIPDANDDTVRIGSSRNNDTAFLLSGHFSGSIDNISIYDYTLSYEEVMFLATNSFDLIVENVLDESINLYIDGVFPDNIINFKDYAVFSNQWLREQSWPLE
jgi:hypothetical protein